MTAGNQNHYIWHFYVSSLWYISFGIWAYPGITHSHKDFRQGDLSASPQHQGNSAYLCEYMYILFNLYSYVEIYQAASCEHIQKIKWDGPSDLWIPSERHDVHITRPLHIKFLFNLLQLAWSGTYVACFCMFYCLCHKCILISHLLYDLSANLVVIVVTAHTLSTYNGVNI